MTQLVVFLVNLEYEEQTRVSSVDESSSLVVDEGGEPGVSWLDHSMDVGKDVGLLLLGVTLVPFDETSFSLSVLNQNEFYHYILLN